MMSWLYVLVCACNRTLNRRRFSVCISAWKVSSSISPPNRDGAFILCSLASISTAEQTWCLFFVVRAQVAHFPKCCVFQIRFVLYPKEIVKGFACVKVASSDVTVSSLSDILFLDMVFNGYVTIHSFQEQSLQMWP